MIAAKCVISRASSSAHHPQPHRAVDIGAARRVAVKACRSARAARYVRRLHSAVAEQSAVWIQAPCSRAPGHIAFRQDVGGAWSWLALPTGGELLRRRGNVAVGDVDPARAITAVTKRRIALADISIRLWLFRFARPRFKRLDTPDAGKLGHRTRLSSRAVL